MDSFIESFRWEADGALYMYAILVVGAFVIAIAIERAYFLMVKANINASKFMSEIRKLVRAGEYKKALALCDAAPEKALAQVVGASLRRVAEQEVTDFRSIQNSVDESTLEVIPRLNQRTGFLAMLANVATLLGLMGTIWGLILAFKAVSSAGIDAAEKARMLAAGISAAMNTTLLGLAVAIPSILIYTFLFNKTAKIIDEIDERSKAMVG